MSTVGIVTVLYNSETVLEDYFRSLNDQTFKDFTLYIIDNKSPDRSLVLAQKLSKEVGFNCVFFPEENNWGVAKGNNIGIKAALKDNCKYILLSNNDVVLNNNDTLEILISKMDNSDIDILCPTIYYYDNPRLIWAAGGTYVRFDMYTHHYGMRQEYNGEYNSEKYISYTPTCFVVIRADVFDKIGFMDEWYFVYFDDTDFMYRAYKAGLNMLYTPRTSILHKESVSTGNGSPFQNYFLARNHLYFVKKNRSIFVFWLLMIIKLVSFCGVHIWTRDRKNWMAELRGLKEGFSKSIKFCKN